MISLSSNNEPGNQWMRKIFLDVGGHRGQTVREIVKDIYQFDTIHCFEPLPENADSIEAGFRGVERLHLHRFGLSNQAGAFPIYERTIGDMGASMKRVADTSEGRSTECAFMRASDFFRDNLHRDDLVIMKLNCEGAECDILNDLIDTGEIEKIDNVMIDFDVRKFPDLASDESKLLKRFKDAGFDRFSLATKVMKGKTHQNRIANWLSSLEWHRSFRSPLLLSERIAQYMRGVKTVIKSAR